MWSRLHVWRGDPPHVTSLTWDPPPPCKEALREHNDQAPGYVVYSSAVTHACGSEDMRARAYAKIKNKNILQIDIFRKFYSNIAYLVWGLFYINSVWKTFAFLTFRWQKNNQDFCVYTCLLGHSWICVQSVRLSACKGATSSKVSIFENPLISPSLCVNQEGREGRVCHFD